MQSTICRSNPVPQLSTLFRFRRHSDTTLHIRLEITSWESLIISVYKRLFLVFLRELVLTSSSKNLRSSKLELVLGWRLDASSIPQMIFNEAPFKIIHFEMQNLHQYFGQFSHFCHFLEKNKRLTRSLQCWVYIDLTQNSITEILFECVQDWSPKLPFRSLIEPACARTRIIFWKQTSAFRFFKQLVSQLLI